MVEVSSRDNGHNVEVNSTDGIHEITHGQSFSTEGAKLTAIHCPGHTDDHIAFLLEDADGNMEVVADDAGAVFSGDNVLGHGTSVFEDLALYLKSLANMKEALGHSGLLYPAHGEVIKDGRGKIDEYVKHRKEREEQVVGILSTDKEAAFGSRAAPGGWTSRELTRAIYKGIDEGLLDAAERGIVMILAKLEGEGRAKKTGEQWWFAGKAKF